MAQPIDISNPAVHGHYAALVTHPGYYYLYALYADYPINNAWFRRAEYADALAERLRVLQPLLALVQPYRKSTALRLFTERQSRDRFAPEQANEAWRELRELIERAGPPAGWPDATPEAPKYRHSLPAGLRRKPWRGTPPPSEVAEASAPRADKPQPRLPKSPVDYSQDV